MGQKSNASRTAANEARAYGKFVRSSPRKLNLVAEMIRGQKAGKALIDLDFCPRRIAKEVKKVLLSAVSNAENNHNLDVDRLIVAEATVGRQLVMKRFMPRARGRSAGIEKWFSNLTVVVREQQDKE
jgi:large subunit ribosomal protein L22